MSAPHFLALALLGARTFDEIEGLRAAAGEGEVLGSLWRMHEVHYDRATLPGPRYTRRKRAEPPPLKGVAGDPQRSRTRRSRTAGARCCWRSRR